MPSQPRFAFIVGAPRCGTTFLSYLLRKHPDVCFSLVKEPHFFAARDLRGLDEEALRAAVEHDYLERFFGHCDRPDQLRVEGSVSYLYIPEQVAPVLRLWPDAKFIIAVRDPFAMLPSLHARLLVTGDETIRSFKRAWDAIPARREGRQIPRSCLDPRWLRYDEAGAFGTYVSRFLDVIGRERCHIVVYDDLAANPEATYAELCHFLNLEPVPDMKFSRRRATAGVRWHWLQRFLKRPPGALRSLLAGEKFLQREGKLPNQKAKGKSGNKTKQTKTGLQRVFEVRKRLLKWNQVPAKIEPVPAELQQDIAGRLRGEIAELARLLDRDLSHWLGGVPEAKPAQPRQRGTSQLASP